MSTRTQIREELDQNYKEVIKSLPLSKYSYLADIFGITSYDSFLDEIIVKKMLKIIEVILSGDNLIYQNKSEANYLNYIIMCNIPFIADNIDWGISIRTAWFEEKFSIYAEGILEWANMNDLNVDE